MLHSLDIRFSGSLVNSKSFRVTHEGVAEVSKCLGVAEALEAARVSD